LAMAGFIYIALVQETGALEPEKRQQQQFNYVASVAGISAAIAVVVAMYVIRKRPKRLPPAIQVNLDERFEHVSR
jgi:uncharacterized membrane protein affecting hemolysin expression